MSIQSSCCRGFLRRRVRRNRALPDTRGETALLAKTGGDSQASLIARCIIDIGHDATELVTWLKSVRSQIYLRQCFVDLRVEPRWLPDFGFRIS